MDFNTVLFVNEKKQSSFRQKKSLGNNFAKLWH